MPGVAETIAPERVLPRGIFTVCKETMEFHLDQPDRASPLPQNPFAVQGRNLLCGAKPECVASRGLRTHTVRFGCRPAPRVAGTAMCRARCSRRVSATPQFGWKPPLSATTLSHAALRA